MSARDTDSREYLVCKIDQLERELDALQEALERIRDKTTGVGAMFESIREIARDALADRGQE